jgi:hypothetical protein
MIDRTYDIKSGNNTIASDVSADNVMMIINSLMDNGYGSIIIREHIEQSDIDKIASESIAELSELSVVMCKLIKSTKEDDENGT